MTCICHCYFCVELDIRGVAVVVVDVLATHYCSIKTSCKPDNKIDVTVPNSRVLLDDSFLMSRWLSDSVLRSG